MEVIHSSDWLTITAKAEKTVEIDITGIIGGSFWDDDPEAINTSDKLRAELKAIADLKVEKIIVNIDSPGGSVSHGLSIHDLLAQHPAKKETRIIGMTASIATIISQAGNVRKISDNALMLLHQPSILAAGNKTDIASAMEILNAAENRMKSIYSKRSGKPEQDFSDIMAENNGQGKWFDSKEAKEVGLVDEIFEPTRAAAVYDKELFNKLKYPEIPIIMSKKSDETKTLFNTIKESIIAIFTVEDKEAKLPDEVNAKLTEFEQNLTELEVENTNLETKLTDSDSKIQELTGALAAKEAEITAKQSEIDAKIRELETKESEILQLQAKSTIVPGKSGAEGLDEGVTLTEAQKALEADVNMLKSMASEIRTDGLADEIEEKITKKKSE